MKTQRTGSLNRELIALLAGAVLCGISALQTSAAQRPRRVTPNRHQAAITELRTTEQLKEAFERDAGKVRLVALLSPT